MRTILTWYQSGGPFMVPLLIVGAAGLLLLVERVTVIVLRSRIKARPFMERVLSLTRANKVDEAIAICVEHTGALSDLGVVLLRTRSKDEHDLLQLAEASRLSVLPALTRRLAWLPVFAHLAVLIGIVGGIANLHDALTANSAPGALSLGIANALRPIGAGVVTAIPLVAGHGYLREEAQAIMAQLEEFSTRLISALVGKPDVRLGHRS